MPLHNIRLKVNAIIILLRNLSIPLGNCNGTRFRVDDLKKRLIVATNLTNNRKCIIPRMPLTSDIKNFPLNYDVSNFQYDSGMQRQSINHMDKHSTKLEFICHNLYFRMFNYI